MQRMVSVPTASYLINEILSLAWHHDAEAIVARPNEQRAYCCHTNRSACQANVCESMYLTMSIDLLS